MANSSALDPTLSQLDLETLEVINSIIIEKKDFDKIKRAILLKYHPDKNQDNLKYKDIFQIVKPLLDKVKDQDELCQNIKDQIELKKKSIGLRESQWEKAGVGMKGWRQGGVNSGAERRRASSNERRREVEEKAKREEEARRRAQAEEERRRAQEQRARKEAEEKARRDADRNARKEAEEKARREAEEKAKKQEKTVQEKFFIKLYKESNNLKDEEVDEEKLKKKFHDFLSKKKYINSKGEEVQFENLDFENFMQKKDSKFEKNDPFLRAITEYFLFLSFVNNLKTVSYSLEPDNYVKEMSAEQVRDTFISFRKNEFTIFYGSQEQKHFDKKLVHNFLEGRYETPYDKTNSPYEPISEDPVLFSYNATLTKYPEQKDAKEQKDDYSPTDFLKSLDDAKKHILNLAKELEKIQLPTIQFPTIQFPTIQFPTIEFPNTYSYSPDKHIENYSILSNQNTESTVNKLRKFFEGLGNKQSAPTNNPPASTDTLGNSSFKDNVRFFEGSPKSGPTSMPSNSPLNNKTSFREKGKPSQSRKQGPSSGSPIGFWGKKAKEHMAYQKNKKNGMDTLGIKPGSFYCN